MVSEPADSAGTTLAMLCAAHPDASDRIERAHAARCAGPPGRVDGFTVAALLHELGADADTLVAGLLSAPELAGNLDETVIATDYGESVARLVRNARWLNAFREGDAAPRANEPAARLRAMIFAVAEDVRAVLIRLAYRTVRMRDLVHEDADARTRLARETLDLYAPIASRLGIHRLKWELEDQAFRCLEPETYHSIARGLAERRQDRQHFIDRFTADLHTALTADGLNNVEVFGRAKHIYSIWRKMQLKHVDFDQLFDIHAVRILVERVQDCYTALGSVHARWVHVPHEFDDYITQPKENGYQSLHTAVIGPWGRPVEVQIRTHEMNRHAEHGIAAHWLYKEGAREPAGLERNIATLRTLLETSPDDGLGDALQQEILGDRVFVFTPRGEVIDLPRGATALDFAFAIHTDIGYRCRGARVNGQIVSLAHALANGDHVEILTTRESRPGRDWLNRDLGYLRTQRARAKVRAWFNQQGRQHHIEEGRALLERELKRLNARNLRVEDLVRQIGYSDSESLYIALGRNEVTSQRIAGAIQSLTQPPRETDEIPRSGRGRVEPAAGGEAVRIEGADNVLTRMANCCRPVPGDQIIGYITRGRGVTVHRRDCHNILRLDGTSRDRLIEVAWGDGGGQNWDVEVVIEAFDRSGLLRDVTQVLTENGVYIGHAGIEHLDDAPRVRIHLTIRVRDMTELNRALQRLDPLPNVLEARRSN